MARQHARRSPQPSAPQRSRRDHRQAVLAGTGESGIPPGASNAAPGAGSAGSAIGVTSMAGHRATGPPRRPPKPAPAPAATGRRSVAVHQNRHRGPAARPGQHQAEASRRPPARAAAAQHRRRAGPAATRPGWHPAKKKAVVVAVLGGRVVQRAAGSGRFRRAPTTPLSGVHRCCPETGMALALDGDGCNGAPALLDGLSKARHAPRGVACWRPRAAAATAG